MIDLNEETPIEETPSEEIPAEEPTTEEPVTEEPSPEPVPEDIPVEEPPEPVPTGGTPDDDSDNFLYMIYDHDGYPADFQTMLLDMTMLNGDHLQRIEIWLMLILLLMLVRMFSTRRRH